MALLLKIGLMLAGVVVAGCKGLKFLWDPIDPNGQDVSRMAWGLNDPRLDPEWNRVGGNEPMSHVLTNLPVEYVEALGKTGLRRAVKLGCAAVVFLPAAAFLLGVLVG